MLSKFHVLLDWTVLAIYVKNIIPSIAGCLLWCCCSVGNNILEWRSCTCCIQCSCSCHCVCSIILSMSFDGVGLLLVLERLMTAENNVVLGEFFFKGDDDMSLPPLPHWTIFLPPFAFFLAVDWWTSPAAVGEEFVFPLAFSFLFVGGGGINEQSAVSNNK